MLEGLGDRFQSETKYIRGEMRGVGLDWSHQPETYKIYKDARRIQLPKPTVRATMSLDEALRKRKSIRVYTSEPLPLEELSYLLWAANGIQRQENGLEFRTAPSAGALYPIETYLIVSSITDLTPGVYHYAVRDHELEVLKTGNFSHEAMRAGLGQEMIGLAAVTFVWTAVFERSKWKYHQRAYRYVYLDTGHIAQNLALAATAFELGSCQIGALYDDEVNQIIGVDGVEESVLYMCSLGWPKE